MRRFEISLVVLALAASCCITDINAYGFESSDAESGLWGMSGWPPGIRDFYTWSDEPGTFLVFDTDADGLYFAFFRADASAFDAFAVKAERLADTLEIVIDRTGSEPVAGSGDDC